jgi:hypothetical protein
VLFLALPSVHRKLLKYPSTRQWTNGGASIYGAVPFSAEKKKFQ